MRVVAVQCSEVSAVIPSENCSQVSTCCCSASSVPVWDISVHIENLLKAFLLYYTVVELITVDNRMR
jgi:hypothetical protein